MKAEFNSTLKKAEYLKRNLKPNDTCPPAEKSIYDSALQMVPLPITIESAITAGFLTPIILNAQGRDGAVAEVLRNFGKAESLYVRSTQLLQLLSDEARHASDKSVLDSCTYSTLSSWLPLNQSSPHARLPREGSHHCRHCFVREATNGGPEEADHRRDGGCNVPHSDQRVRRLSSSRQRATTRGTRLDN